MPASNEITANRPLSGTELREIMLRDLAAMLDRDGMFTPHIAYRRAAFSITVKLHVDNPMYPEHTVKVESKTPPRNIGKDDPKGALLPPPLKNPSEEAVIAGAVHEREIDSPNTVRAELALPVTIVRKDGNTGQMKEEQVVYDATHMELPPPKTAIKDISEQVEQEWSE